LKNKQAPIKNDIQMKRLVLFLALCTNFALFAQNSSFDTCQHSKSTLFYLEVDELPKFQSGVFRTALEYICSKIEYPRQIDVNGAVIVSFIVTKDGIIEDIKIEKGIQKDCDNEVKRVLLEMPKWIPGRKNDENVNTLLLLRVDFTVR
jgi:protein TonB